MTQNRKYLGMTIRQVGILAGLAVLACLIMGVTGGLALRGSLGLFSRPPESTPVPQFTATPFVIPTVTPTETPTPIPYEQLIPFGWTQHQTQARLQNCERVRILTDQPLTIGMAA